jgi:peptide/nickel transport system substrate-binding protein
MRPVRLRGGIASLLALALILAACTADDPGDPAADDPDTDDEVAGPVIDDEDLEEVVEIEGLADVAREHTLVLTPWGFHPTIPNHTNFNVYQLGAYNHQREIGNKGIYEMLMYTNLNTGELIPWQAESFEYNDDFTEITVNVRDGVTWSDGEPFTAEDIAWTLLTVRDHSPDLRYATIYEEWVEDVEVVDDLTAVIKLTEPNPRWFQLNLALGHENHQVILPKHIWENEDIAEFENFDLEAGHPVGTGPYELVRSSPQQMILDRRDSWWGEEIGFAEMPAPERIVLVPNPSDEAAAQMYINNQIDSGDPLQPGTFEAARGRNDRLITWNEEGPIWGAPDGCNYQFIFNNMKEPWDDRDVRLAINYAIDRQLISDLGYEGANYPNIAPFSGYGAIQEYVEKGLQDVIDAADRMGPDLERVEQHMTAAGFERDAEGYWARDGERLVVPVRGPEFFRALAAPIAQSLEDAGIEAVENVEPGGSTAWNDDLHSGDADTIFFVHCGSLSDPYETLRHLHSRFARPIGERVPDIIASSRYENPEYDAIIDEMEVMEPSPDDPEYMDLAKQALEIYLDDMPSIQLAEELHAVVFNTTYWEGWPTAANDHMAPYPPWNGFYMIIHNLEPAS